MRYFIAKNGVQLGPFETREVQEQLASGAVSLEDLVWRDGMAAWAPLRTEFSPTTPPPISPVGTSANPSPAAATHSQPMSFATASTPAPAAQTPSKTGFVLGLVNLITWFIPLVGLPLSIWGLVASIKALRQGGGGLAITGLILNSIALILTLVNAAVGAYLGATGRHPLFR